MMNRHARRLTFSLEQRGADGVRLAELPSTGEPRCDYALPSGPDAVAAPRVIPRAYRDGLTSGKGAGSVGVYHIRPSL